MYKIPLYKEEEMNVHLHVWLRPNKFISSYVKTFSFEGLTYIQILQFSFNSDSNNNNDKKILQVISTDKEYHQRYIQNIMLISFNLDTNIDSKLITL